jgi:MscS family membrane protein
MNAARSKPGRAGCQASLAISRDQGYRGSASDSRSYLRAAIQLFRLLFLAALLTAPLWAQLPSLPTAPKTQSNTTNSENFDDPLGRSTPRGTVKEFIETAQRGDLARAVSYLDTRQKGELAEELARQLEFVLDHETSIDLDNLSDKPEGDVADNLQPNRDLVGMVKTAGGQVAIYVDRVQRGDNPPVWLFSSDTLRHIPEAYGEVSASDIEQHLPPWLVHIRFLNWPIWRWGALLLAIPLVLIVSALLRVCLRPLLQLMGQRLTDGQQPLEALTAPVRLLMIGVIARVASSYLYSLLARNFWQVAGDVLVVAGVSWLLARIVTIAINLGMSRLKQSQAPDRIALMQMLGRIAQVLVVTFGGLGILYLVGINLTAALTGLGIGGLAVAFAAQKTLENLFGGVMIISDRPIRIGDYCKVGDYSGTVIDIGFRSTRIRTGDRTVVSIPNGQLATMNIENFTLRDKFWFHPTVSLQHDTTSQQMTVTLGELRKLLEQHPKVEPGTHRVSFFRLGSSSQDIEIFAYVFAANYNEFMKTQESLLLQILSVVEAAGASIALPSQKMYAAAGANSGSQQSAGVSALQTRDDALK